MKRNDIIVGIDYATKPANYRSVDRVRVISTAKGEAYVRYSGNETNTVLVQEILTRMTYATLDGVELRDSDGKRIETGTQEVPWGEPKRIQLSRIDQPWADYVKERDARNASIERGRIAMEARKASNLELFQSTKERVKAHFDYGFIHDHMVTESKIGVFTPAQWSQLVSMVDALTESTLEHADA